MNYRIVGKWLLDYPDGWLVTEFRIVEDTIDLDGIRYHIHPSTRADSVPGRVDILGVDPGMYVAGIRWTEKLR